MKKIIQSAVLAASIFMSQINPSFACMNKSDYFNYSEKSIVYIYVVTNDDKKGHGTGVVVDSNGTIVTSTHVIKDAKKISIIFYNGTSYTYKTDIVGDDYSISTLKPEVGNVSNMLFANVSDKNPSVGEEVFTIGYPLSYNKMINIGYVSSLIDESVMTLGINTLPGMSGSPVFNCDGNIVGFIYGFRKGYNFISVANTIKDFKNLKGE